MCNKTEAERTIEDFYECFEAVSPKQEEMIIRTSSNNRINAIGFKSNIIVEWKSVFFNPLMGKCFSAEIPIESYEKKIKIRLIKKMYKIFIYDPNYFIGSINPSGTPTIKFDFDMINALQPASGKQMIAVKQMSLLNRKKQKCITYKETYMDCVTASIVKKVGHQLKESWSSFRDYGYPYCTSLDEVKMHHDFWVKITG